MLRVLQCVVGMNRGGIETMLVNIFRKIDRTKIVFDFLVSLDGTYDEEIKRLGGKIYKIPFFDRVGPFQYAKSLRAFFAAHPEYQVIHVQMDKFGGIVVRESKKCNIPVRIMHSHNTQNEGSLLVRLVKEYYGRYCLDATHWFACGEDAARWMFKEDFQRATIIHNGVDLDLFINNDTRKNGQFKIGHIGRMNKNKNHHFLLEVFEKIYHQEPTAQLFFAGDGPLREGLVLQAAKNGIQPAVTFLGICEDIPALLAELDVLCMPSLFEGLPVSLVEAQAAGLPCVVSDTISKETNLTGDIEYVSLQDSPQDWANRLLCYKGRIRSQGNAERLNLAGYSIEKIAQELEDFYCHSYVNKN